MTDGPDPATTPPDRAQRGAAEQRPTVPAPPVGQAPLVLAASSVGVALVALAYGGGRASAAWAEPLYWLGQVVVFVPVVARMAARRLAGGGEALLLVLGLAVNQYLLKWMYSPDQFRFPDELQHFAATNTIMESGRLFEPNPALPVAEGFPGLAEMGAAVATVTSLSATTSGFLVAGLARLGLVAALFALVRRAGGTARLAGLTCLVYSTGQHYLFFNAMYLYQAAATTFLLIAVWALTARHRGARGLGTAVVATVAIAVVTVTHHVTAFFLVAVLVALAVTDAVAGLPRRADVTAAGRTGRGGGTARRPWTKLRRRWEEARPRWETSGFAALAALAVGLWIALPARTTLDYFKAPAQRAWDSLVQLVTGEVTPSQGGPAGPGWQFAVQVAALLVLLALLVRAVLVVRRARPRDPWRYLVLGGGVAFFAGHALWFAGPQGSELVGRASTFTFLPMAMVAAGELVRLRGAGRAPSTADHATATGGGTSPRRHGRIAGWPARAATTVLVATLLMVSARATGWPPWWERLPGPYRPGSFERSIGSQGVTAARFTGAWLGRQHLITADSAGWILLASYGKQSPIAGQAADIYYSPRFGLAEAQLVDRLSVEFVWVDLRMAEQTPGSGAYFTADPRAGQHDAPVPRANLTKFDELPGVDLVFDSGDIRIYDIRDV